MTKLQLYADQNSLFCGLQNMHCISALATEEGNAFESQNGVAMVQASKVKLSGHGGHDFRHILVFLRT